MNNKKYLFIISAIIIALSVSATACDEGNQGVAESRQPGKAASATDSSIAQSDTAMESTDSSMPQSDEDAESADISIEQADGNAYDSTAIAGFPKNTVKSNHAEGFTDGELSDIVDRTEDGRFEEVAGSYGHDEDYFPVHSSLIYDAYTEDSKLKIFVLTAYIFYSLNGEYVTEQSGGIVHAALTYEVGGDGVAVLTEYMPPEHEGGLLDESIRKFCKMPVSGKKIPGLAEKMMNYDNDESLELHEQRLISYLKSLGLTSAKFKKYSGDSATQLY